MKQEEVLPCKYVCFQKDRKWEYCEEEAADSARFLRFLHILGDLWC